MVKGIDGLGQFINGHYEIREWRHASAILYTDFEDEWIELAEVLTTFRLPESYILTPGGGKSPIARAVNGKFADFGWEEKSFDTTVTVDGEAFNTPTHKVDYYKNNIAIEMEWNNKDPFYDRDLNNFRLLHSLGVVSVGVIITRTDGLQKIFDRLGKGKSYGNSTTHMGKLIPRLEGGGAGGCPVLVFGIETSLFVPGQ